jgi:hypothetical protein
VPSACGGSTLTGSLLRKETIVRTWKRIAVAAIVLGAVGGVAAAVRPLAAAASNWGQAVAPDPDTAESDVVLASAATVPDSCPKSPKVGTICGHTRILLVAYWAKTECRIQDNYPHNAGASRKTWTITPGAKIIWRYSVNAHVALISDPARNTFPHWGFVTNSECIGTTVGQHSSYWKFEKPKNAKARWVQHATSAIPAGQPVPSRLLYGRSQSKQAHYWNRVDWTPVGPTVPAAGQKMTHNRTLRDRPNEFVIGNVKAGWEVRLTGQHQAGYTKVYVPSLHR